jgi:hypothetical protein
MASEFIEETDEKEWIDDREDRESDEEETMVLNPVSVRQRIDV